MFSPFNQHAFAIDKPASKKRKAQGDAPATKPTDNGVVPLGAIKSVKVVVVVVLTYFCV